MGVSIWFKDQVAETKEAAIEAYTFARKHNWKATARTVFARKYWGWWALLVFVITLSTVLSAYHNQIGEAIHPYAINIAHSKWAWIIPFILLIVVSFPPLFGHELILLVCGLIWGLMKGFIIACAGTFFGELATYFAFKYAFRKRAAQFECENVFYACLAKLMRDGGLSMLILVRFSAMPGHLVTACQSCIGIGVWYYAIACFLTLPKQFSLVYLGKIFSDTTVIKKNQNPDWNTAGGPGVDLQRYHAKNRKISLIVFAVTTLATIIAAYIVWIRARRIRPTVLVEMSARRQANELQDEESSMPSVPKFELGQLTNSTTLKSVSTGSLNSPSLPHLPYHDEEDNVDYLNSQRRRRGSAPG